MQCYEFQSDGSYQALAGDAIAAALAKDSGFVWLHLEAGESDALAKLPELGLHQLIQEDLGQLHKRSKLDTYTDTLFLVVRALNLGDPTRDCGEFHLVLGPRYLITLPQNTIQGEAPTLNSGSFAKLPRVAPDALLHQLLDGIVDQYLLLLEHLQQQFQELEADLFDEDAGRSPLQESYHLKRQLVQLRDTSIAIGDICDDLARARNGLIHKSLRAYFRDISNHCQRLEDTCDRLRDMLMTALQINLALVSIDQNDTSRKLAGWAAVLAIPTMVFGLYGMNFENMPELKWHYGYFAVLGGVVIACGLLYRRLRKAGWL